MSERKLTYKQKALADFWLGNGFVGWRAAESAGYQGSKDTLYVRASEVLAMPHVKKYIATRMEENTMDGDQALAEMSNMARGEVMYYVEEDGSIDLDALKKNGLIRNVEEIRTTSRNVGRGDNAYEVMTTNVKVVNRRQATQDLLKVHDKIKPKSEVHVIGFNEALKEAYGQEGDDE